MLKIIKNIIIKIIRIADPKFRLKKYSSKKNLIIGKDSFVSGASHMDTTGLIRIGKNCLITAGVKIFTHSHYIINEKRNFSMEKEGKNIFIDPIVIEDNVIIYTDSIIMPSVKRIHKGCLIYPATVLSKSTTAPYQIWSGNPAKLIGTKLRDDY